MEIPKVENLNDEDLGEELDLEEDDFEIDFSDEESSNPDDVNEELEIPEVTEEDEDAEEDEQESNVQSNLSKAVKAKNKTIQELKDKMAKLEEKLDKPSSDPYDLKLEQATSTSGPKTAEMERQIEAWDKYFDSELSTQTEYDDPALFRRQQAAYNRLNRDLPKVERQERKEREAMKKNKQACLNAVLKANPHFDDQQAEYVFNTADFSKDTPASALKKSAKKWNDFLDSCITKRNSKGSAKKRIVKGNSKQSGVASNLKGVALYNKALGVLRKDKAHFNELKVLYPGDKLKTYIKDNAKRIIKGD